MNTFRVFRGGGWGNDAALYHDADRSGGDPDFRFSETGFRCFSYNQARKHQLVRGGTTGIKNIVTDRNRVFRDVPSSVIGLRCWRRK